MPYYSTVESEEELNCQIACYIASQEAQDCSLNLCMSQTVSQIVDMQSVTYVTCHVTIKIKPSKWLGTALHKIPRMENGISLKCRLATQ